MKISLTGFLFLIITGFALSQSDTLIASNGDVLVGEIKGMERSILTMETDYSDSDFKIDWDMVREIYSNRLFIITTDEGKRYYGNIRSLKSDITTVLVTERKTQHSVKISDIVFINQVDEDFLSRLSVSIGIGFSYARTNNLTQFSMMSNIGYLTDQWNLTANYNGVRSSQDEVEPTTRNEGGTDFRYFLPADWFVMASYGFLQNDEQKLKLRSITQLGAGNYIIRTNSIYLSVAAGAAWNNENYTDTIPGRNSAEGFAGLELNMFDIGDLSLLTSLVAYPSFTEKGRFRSDFKFDLKYDFPLDIYIKLGYMLNYDNKPVEGASDIDYIFQTTFGWEFN